MDRSVAAPRHLMRLLLSALGVAGGLVLLGLAFGSVSASATESGTSSSDAAPGPSTGTGLLGSVGSLLGTITAPVSGLTGTVTSTVSAVVDPLTQAVPAPVQQTVAPVTRGVGSAAQSVSVSAVLTPVSGAIDRLVSSVPVAGPVLSTTLGSVSSVTSPVTGLVDNALGDVGSLTGALLGPQVPGSGAAPAPPDTSSSESTTAPGSVVNCGPPAAAAPLLRSITATPSTVEYASRAGHGIPEQADPPTDSTSGLISPPGHSSGPNTPGPDSTPGSQSAPGLSSSSGASVSTSPEEDSTIERSAFASPARSEDRLPATPTFDTDSPPD